MSTEPTQKEKLSKGTASKKFSSLLPPPNLTGVLHLGHIWNATIQDFIIRWHKLLNHQTSWPLGLDHAGLSLQIRFEKELKSQGTDINSLSEEEYKKGILNWKNRNASHIKEQFNSMNFSINYEDEAYTMDDFSEKYSLKIFKQLFEEGLIYQSETLINWDTGLKTAISDSEVTYTEKNINLYYLKYYFEDSQEGEKQFIEIATTRPETIFGDVAIFVNPEDERYKKYLKKHVLIPFINKPIPILFDPAIEMDFGSGCMKCSPAHDFLDWDLYKKHKLEIKKSFDIDGIISEGAGDLTGLHKDEAKDRLIKHLENTEDVRIEKYTTNVAYSERSGSIIEPSISKQWFLASAKLSKNLLEHISNMKLGFYPKKYSNITKKILENMHDWCISRQIKWGIQFPIFIHKQTKKVVCSLDSLDSSEYEQIADRLDTWFTSSLWALIVFNDDRKQGLGPYFPIDLLVSGKDILLFWITKMMFMSWHIKKELPFKTTFLHGLILDKNGKKMSKSLGNGITPQELLEKYGSDVIKLFLLNNTFGDDNIKYLEDKLEIPNRFLQKLKNGFYFFNNNGLLIKSTDYKEDLLLWYEKEIWNKFIHIKKELVEYIDNYSFSGWTNKLIDFLWDDFCNLFLEIVKEDVVKNGVVVGNTGNNIQDNSKKFISYMWEQILLLLSPAAPLFASEKIQEMFGNNIDNHFLDFSEKSKKCINTPNRRWFYKYIKISRQIYHTLEINKKEKYSVGIIIPETSLEKFKQENSDVFEYFSLLKQDVISISSKKSDKKSVCFTVDSLSCSTEGNLSCSDNQNKHEQSKNSIDSIDVEIFLSNDLINKYAAFVNKQVKKYTSEVERSERMLSNKAFIEKADQEVVNAENQKKEEYIQKLNFYQNIIYG